MPSAFAESPGAAVTSPIQAKTDVGYAYPVPFKPSAGHTTIKFDNLTTGSIIKIYTVAGELVKELDGPVDQDARMTWDVRNQDGDGVASGVYIYQIKTHGGEKSGKLIIIR